MKSLLGGRASWKKCIDCHQPGGRVIEHRIGSHLENLECYSCHSAWAAQEYGTFYIRLKNSPSGRDLWVKQSDGKTYIKRAYLKMQKTPPLGVNSRGKVSPIRPQFITYFSDIKEGTPVCEENRLLAAQWKAFFPHTIRPGTVMCEGCHNNASRFILEKEEDRIYQPELDGMTLHSFWNQTGQELINGSFMELSRFNRMSAKNPAYIRAYIEKWKSLVDHVDGFSRH
jgi:hypothetical protein